MDQWKLEREGFDPAHVVTDGNRFLCANGYMGLRGVVEEGQSPDLPAITLAGVYDRNGDKWREPVNAPQCLFVRAVLNGKAMALREAAPLHHTCGIDYRHGLYHRDTDFGPLRLESERFVSMDQTHLLADRMRITCTEDGELELTCGISADIWDINGPHLFDFSMECDEALSVTAVTGQLGITVSAAQTVTLDADAEVLYKQNDAGSFKVFRLPVKAGKTLVLSSVAAIYTSLDTGDPKAAARALCLCESARGFDACLSAHTAAWEKVHALSTIEAEGDEAAVQGLHASQYHLNSIAPRHADSMSIPARGLSGQTYKGAIFWDSEIFFFPMFVHTQPEVARALLRYRIETLPGALKKAKGYEYRGAFYAWESQEGGEEGCTDFNVVDVFTHRPVRTYFRDKQIHISADIAYALRSYYEITGDRSLLQEGGAAVILECARFYISRAQLRADKTEVDYPDVIGPDEYHERVTNNAFTNRMIRHCMESALQLEDIFADQPDEFAALLQSLDYAEDWQRLKNLCPRIRAPRIQEGIIEQFDGYFKLEDCSLDTVRSRLCDKREYWGGDHGVAGVTQIIKQADVIAMMALFPDDFSAEQLAANWTYYEPRTEHGSSLSACMYALTACRIGKPDLAWELFLKTACIDVLGGGKEWAGEIYIGGTHPASNGGAWMIAALGFAGLRMKNGQPTIHPNLPEQISKLVFPITAGGKRLRVTVTHGGGIIEEA